MKYSDRFYRISYIDKKGQQRECMASVSLCMIVRNEEQVLGRCLSCVKDFADKIIIVDTGSTDKTKEIASLFTNQIYDFPWIDDFAAARNFAFQKGAGDYLFWLDADDVITKEEQKKLMKLKMRLDQEKPDVVMMKYAVGYDGSGSPSFFFYRERLLRRCERAVWKGRIHEVIEPFGKTVREDILIEHRKIGTGDPDRNLRIFEKMIREKGKIAGLISALIAVATTQKFYDEHPDVIEKLAAAQDEIASYMADSQDKTIETVAAALDLDVDAVKEMYGFYDFSTEITDADKEGFQKTADFMYESGMIENKLDVNTLFIQ